MSQIFDEMPDYAAKYQKIEGSEETLSEAQLKNVANVKVKYSKDNKGNTTDKLCLCFTLANGIQKFKGLDKNSKLQYNDNVKPESVRFFKLTNGQQTIARCDGEAL